MTSSAGGRAGLGFGLLEGRFLIRSAVKRVDRAAPSSDGIESEDDEADAKHPKRNLRVVLLRKESTNSKANDSGCLR